MDYSNSSITSTPVFLSKLHVMIEDESTNELICWDQTGKSFHIRDGNRLAKIVLPHYFKHNNLASFIRQLNMYGFHKVRSVTSAQEDEYEFSHTFFVRGKPNLMSKIKRKLPTAQTVYNSPNNRAITERLISNLGLDNSQFVPFEDFAKLSDLVKHMRAKQDSANQQLSRLKAENHMLYQEIIDLRQQYDQQSKVISTLFNFLSAVAKDGAAHTSCLPGKRKGTLSIEAGTSRPFLSDQSTHALNYKNLLPIQTTLNSVRLPQLTVGPGNLNLQTVTSEPSTLSKSIVKSDSIAGTTSYLVTNNNLLSDINAPLSILQPAYTVQTPNELHLIRQPSIRDKDSVSPINFQDSDDYLHDEENSDDEPPIITTKRRRKFTTSHRNAIAKEFLTRNSLEAIKRSVDLDHTSGDESCSTATIPMRSKNNQPVLMRSISNDMNAINDDLNEIRSLIQNNNSIYHLDSDVLDSIFNTTDNDSQAADPLMAGLNLSSSSSFNPFIHTKIFDCFCPHRTADELYSTKNMPGSIDTIEPTIEVSNILEKYQDENEIISLPWDTPYLDESSNKTPIGTPNRVFGRKRTTEKHLPGKL